VPLGIDHPLDPDVAAVAAERVWTMGWPFHAKRRLRGLRLVATDSSWSAGDGVEVHGPTQSLLLTITGRPAGTTHLFGPGAPDVVRRLAA
jgi:hypothetical protein